MPHVLTRHVTRAASVSNLENISKSLIVSEISQLMVRLLFVLHPFVVTAFEERFYH